MHKPVGKKSFFRRKAGRPPGTLDDGRGKSLDPSRLHFIYFSEASFEETSYSPEQFYKEKEEIKSKLLSKDHISWLNINGVDDSRLLETLGEMMDVHPLVLEDIQSEGHRPKIEEYENHIYMIFHNTLWDEESQNVVVEPVSLLLFENCLITFEAGPALFLEPLLERIRKGKGRIRKMGTAYLSYTLLDVMVDNATVVLEDLNNEIVLAEEMVLTKDIETIDVYSIHRMKRQIISFRKTIWPSREVLLSCIKGEFDLIPPTIYNFIRDVYDHVMQISESVEILNDTLKGIIDAYNSALSNRMNAVMKVLTIIATIFIPLTFIAGIYGMNFQYLPELSWRWSYFTVLGVMVVVAGGMLVFFRRKKWF
jgi:magnesium transporter